MEDVNTVYYEYSAFVVMMSWSGRGSDQRKWTCGHLCEELETPAGCEPYEPSIGSQ